MPASMIRFPQGVRGGVITTETVYETRPKSSIRVANNTRSITNLRTVYPPPVAPVRTVTQAQIPPVISRIIQPVQQPIQQSVQVRRPASPVRVSSRQSIPVIPMTQSIQPITTINRTNIDNHQYNQRVSAKNIDLGTQNTFNQSSANEYYNGELRS